MEQVVSNREWSEMSGVWGVRCEVVYGTDGVESCKG